MMDDDLSKLKARILALAVAYETKSEGDVTTASKTYYGATAHGLRLACDEIGNFRLDKLAREGESVDDEDDSSGCTHEGAVKWNPFNQVTQCHRCGEVTEDVVTERWAVVVPFVRGGSTQYSTPSWSGPSKEEAIRICAEANAEIGEEHFVMPFPLPETVADLPGCGGEEMMPVENAPGPRENA